MSVMLSVLRRHGATIGHRRGRQVPVHFGSVVTEEAVCRTGVGLVERSDRAMLELRGAASDVDRALAELSSLAGQAWSLRLGERDAIVRCEAVDEDACVAAMRRVEDVAILDVAPDHVALGLVGPRAEAVLQASGIEEQGDALVVRRDQLGIELLCARAQGPALWYRLMEAGEPLRIACVGVEAIERLGVSDHLGGSRPS